MRLFVKPRTKIKLLKFCNLTSMRDNNESSQGMPPALSVLVSVSGGCCGCGCCPRILLAKLRNLEPFLVLVGVVLVGRGVGIGAEITTHAEQT